MIFTSDAEERNFREYEEIAAEEARQAKEYAERPFKRTGLGSYWMPLNPKQETVSKRQILRLECS